MYLCYLFYLVWFFFLFGCGKPTALLEKPEVGDVYTVELTHFQSFADLKGRKIEKGYGLMRVIKVDDDNVNLITSKDYFTSRRAATREAAKLQLAGAWDYRSDTIDIERSQLLPLYEANKILEVRRRSKK